MPISKEIRGMVASQPIQAAKADGKTLGLSFRLYEFGTPQPLTHYINVFLIYPPGIYGGELHLCEDQVVSCDGRYVEVRGRNKQIKRYLEGSLASLKGKGLNLYQEELPMDRAAGGAT